MSDDIDTASDAAEQPAKAPFLRVVKGDPTPQELAALTAVLSTAGGAGDDGSAPDKGPRNLWGNPVDKLRPSTGLSPNMFYNLRFDY